MGAELASLIGIHEHDEVLPLRQIPILIVKGSHRLSLSDRQPPSMNLDDARLSLSIDEKSMPSSF